MSKKKQKRGSLKPLLLLLLLTAVILVAATYAWFTSNTQVKVEAINVNVATSSGFQVSTDAVNWKSFITTTDITTGGTWVDNINHIPDPAIEPMKPVSTVGATDSNGLMQMFLGTIGIDPNTNAPALTAGPSADVKGNADYIAFDLFFKTNEAKSLDLDITSNVIGGPDATGTNTKGIESAVRVGFVNEGSLDFASYQASTGVDNARALVGATQVVFWEPNSDFHTQQSILDAKNSYGVAGLTGKVNPYSGVSAPISTAVPLLQANATDNGTLFGLLNAPTSTNGVALLQTLKPTTPATNPNLFLGDGNLAAKQPLGINLGAGVTKVRVYMWIEGQDYDCQDFASGTNLQFNIAFTLH